MFFIGVFALFLSSLILRKQLIFTTVKHEGPRVVFLLETRLELKNVEPLRQKLGMHVAAGVDRTGTSGGLALMWKDGWQVSIQSSSIAHIDATIRFRGSNDWHFTGFYENPETSKKEDSWTLLRRLQRFDNQPWLVVGDWRVIGIKWTDFDKL